MTDPNNPWFVESGAECHISNTESIFRQLDLSIKVPIVMPNGRSTECCGRGRCRIQMINSIGERTTVDFENVYFIPTSPCNFMSVITLLRMGYLVSYAELQCIIRTIGGIEIGVADFLMFGAFTLRQVWPQKLERWAYEGPTELYVPDFMESPKIIQVVCPGTLPVTMNCIALPEGVMDTYQPVILGAEVEVAATEDDLSKAQQEQSRKRKHIDDITTNLLDSGTANMAGPSSEPGTMPGLWSAVFNELSTTSVIYNLGYYPTNISKSMLKLYNEKLFIDVVLIAGDDNVKISAHRIVLSSVSEYFDTKLRRQQEDGVNELKILNIDGCSLKTIIKSIYASSIELNVTTVYNIHNAAELLKLPKVIHVCCDFIEKEIGVLNCLSTALFAETHHYYSLQESSYSYACNHLQAVARESEFLELTPQRLTKLISFNIMAQQSQEIVFNSVLAWVEHDKENRERFLISILHNIRFKFLAPQFIFENRRLVTNSMEGYELICKWLQWHLSIYTYRNAENRIFGYANGISLDNLKIQLFNREINIWLYLDMPRPLFDRVDFGATLKANLLILAGGRTRNSFTSSVEYLNFRTMTWTALPCMRQKRSLFPLVEYNGFLYAVGGRVNDCWISSVERFGLLRGKWENVAPMLTALDHPKVVIHDRCMYVMNATISIMQCYDFFANKWSYRAYKANKSVDFAIASVGRHIYAVGDYCNAALESAVERYDPSTDSWSYVCSLNVPRSGVKCAAINNRLIVCGGNYGENRLDLVEEYNFEMNTWTTLAPLLSHALQPGPTFLFVSESIVIP